MINGDTINHKLSAENGFIDRVVKQDLADEQLLKTLYLAAYSRYPTDGEMAEAVQLLDTANWRGTQLERRHALEDFVWAMLTDKEFVFNH